jgi:hypothetical protein
MSVSKAVAKQREHDWILIQKDWKAGLLSMEAIGKKYGMSRQAIHKRAKAEGWKRDLSDEVRREARIKLQHRQGPESCQMSYPEVPDSEVIDSASDQLVDVVRSHRKSLAKSLEIETKLIAQIERELQLRAMAVSDNPADRIKAAQIAEDGVKPPTLAACTAIYRDITTAQSKRIALERQAFGLDEEKAQTADPIRTLLDEIDGMTRTPPCIDE